MGRGTLFADVSAAIGNTPMIRINRIVPAGACEVFAKCEFFQPLNSVKDRIGVAMIEAAETRWQLIIRTRTSSNRPAATRESPWRSSAPPKATGLTLTMPESMSVERRALLRALGAELILTPAAEGMPGPSSRRQNGRSRKCLDAATVRESGQPGDPRSDDRSGNLGR